MLKSGAGGISPFLIYLFYYQRINFLQTVKIS